MDTVTKQQLTESPRLLVFTHSTFVDRI
jgi:hypothetical protein